MTLVVEDGTGLSTAEAYASVDYVLSTALSMGLGYINPDDPTGDWIADAATADLESACRRAAIYLDTTYYDQWSGAVANTDQALQFPRFGIARAKVIPQYLGGAAYSMGPRTSVSGVPGSYGYGVPAGYGGYGGLVGPGYAGIAVPGAAYYPANVLPPPLVLAAVQVALRELYSPGSLLPDYVESEAIHSESVGPIRTMYFDRGFTSKSPRLPAIEAILRPLLNSGSAGVHMVSRA